jgi:hypothetical protein
MFASRSTVTIQTDRIGNKFCTPFDLKEDFMGGNYVPSFAERLFHSAVDYLGKPYTDTDGEDSFDCSQFVVFVLRRMGFSIPDMRAADLREKLFTLPVAPDTGPLVAAFFRREGGEVVHIGLLGPGMETVIHNSKSEGRVRIQALERVEYTELTYLDCAALMTYMVPVRLAQSPSAQSGR